MIRDDKPIDDITFGIYHVPKKEFIENKKILDGHIFWQEKDDYCLVKMVAPNKPIRLLLEKLTN